MAITQQSKIITPEKLYKLRQPLPRSWVEVVGILKGKKRISPLCYQKQIRKEWDERLKKIFKISSYDYRH